ncbi:MAG: hypothetical protein WKG00_01280 [Polyangiaceae bacterium]
MLQPPPAPPCPAPPVPPPLPPWPAPPCAPPAPPSPPPTPALLLAASLDDEAAPLPLPLPLPVPAGWSSLQPGAAATSRAGARISSEAKAVMRMRRR